MKAYTDDHAASGMNVELPAIETWPNQFPHREYEIEIASPEFTSVCPKTGLPDHGTLTVRYVPEEHCLELKSYKMYLFAYRNLGIFQENIVNRVLDDIVRATNARKVTVIGDFTPRGGIYSKISATYTRGN
jgi:7-cyano-7-deazaguanine reductase